MYELYDHVRHKPTSQRVNHKFGILSKVTLFCRVAVSRQFIILEETIVLGKTTILLKAIGNFPTCFEPDSSISSERQRAISGNDLVHSTIGAGPKW